MKPFAILAALTLSAAAFGQQPICQSHATGPQLYSVAPGDGVPQYDPGALNEALGYIPQAYVKLPGMPDTVMAFCGPAWQPNHEYAVGNLIQLPNGIVLQAISCTPTCKSGTTQPAGFSGPLFEPSPVIGWVSTCSDTGSTATCSTVTATGTLAGINTNEPYQGPASGAYMVITDYQNPAYDGPRLVTSSTITPNPCGLEDQPPCTAANFSFSASNLGSGNCTTIGGAPACTVYQQGSQITDNQVTWQDVGPQNEVALLTPTVTVTPSASSITTAQSLNVTVVVSGESGHPTPTGLVTLTSGSYTSGTTTLSDGIATITIPAGSLAVGTDTLTATYFGDGNYSNPSGSSSVTVTETGPLMPTVTVTPSVSSITTSQSLNVTVAVSGGSGNPTPTGTVTLTGGGYTSAATMLSDGSATITIPAGSLAVGTDTLTASYSGDSNYSAATGTASVTVTEAVLLTPTVTVTPSASSVATTQALNVTVAVSGGSGNPTPTGTVTLTSGSYSSGTTPLSDGSATITIPAGSLAVGTDTLTASYSGDSNYSAASGTSSVTVADFTIAGTPVSVSPGATTGNTSTITVTSVNDFTGSVTLIATITSSPAGAQDLPTFSFSPASSVNIAPDTPGTVTLIISTTAATSGALAYPVRPVVRRHTARGIGLVAFALIFGIGGIGIGLPARRRSWRLRVGMLALLVTLIAGLLACGGSGSGGIGNSGTTPGSYTVTVTGTSSGGTMATGTVTLTVQ